MSQIPRSAASSTSARVVASGKTAPVGLPGAVGEDDLRPRGDQRLDLRGRREVAGRSLEPVEDRLAAEQPDHLVHVRKAGRRQQHLVARLEHGQVDREERVHRAGSDDDALRVDGVAVDALELSHELLSEAEVAAVRRVPGPPVRRRFERCVDDEPRRDEARLADLEPDRVGQLVRGVEDLADRRAPGDQRLLRDGRHVDR